MELNKIYFLLFVLLMIFPAHAYDVLLASADGNFKQRSELYTLIRNGQTVYFKPSNNLIYEVGNGTTKVIVYIIDRSRFVEIMRNAGVVRDARLQIAHELREWHHELVFLGIENFDDDEYHLISEFVADIIKRHPSSQTNYTIETIGENYFDRDYRCPVLSIEKYEENAQICGGALQARLRAIPHGALRPVGSNNKRIRLFDYHINLGEVRWPVNVVNGTYFPDVDLNVPQYNFKIRFPDRKICLLILGGKEYLKAVKDAERLREETEVTRIIDEMTNNNEVLIILGAFNFDWTEIDIVTQIIQRHSGGWQGWNIPAANVFTCGYGMFNTVYQNSGHLSARFPLQPQSNVSELIEVLMGEEVKERVIKMYFPADGRWWVMRVPINLVNGRYIAEGESIDYSFPWVDQKIAFIVYHSAEAKDPTPPPMVFGSVKDLTENGIYAIVIEAINFGLDDMHIIAEWIDYHRGIRTHNSNRRVINSEQIAVLGAGIFDTIFQSKSTTYKTLLNTKKNELKAIRDAYVKSGNGKSVFVGQIDNPGYKDWTYPMDTVNGHYECDLIPDKNMFDTTGGKNIFFIISSANRVSRISSNANTEEVNLWLRDEIEQQYPRSNWTVFLVGLYHFGKRDHYLFAELVKAQTHDERSLDKFVRTFNYGIGSSVYQYKDTRPFPSEKSSQMKTLIKSFFVASR